MLINSVGSCALQNYDSYDTIISVITSVICVTTDYNLKLDGLLFVLRHFATRKKISP